MSSIAGLAWFLWAERLVIAYVAAINTTYLVLMLLAYFDLRDESLRLSPQDRAALKHSPLLPAISVLAPAFNEAATIRDSVQAMLNLEYPNYEVVVINDGSRDDTLSILIDAFRLYKSARAVSRNLQTKPVNAVYESRDPIRLIVVDKQNGGKADALNAGMRVARSPLVAITDSDSLLETSALLLAAKPFLEDSTTLAAGGIIRVANGCDIDAGRVVRVRVPRSFLVASQVIEYLRAFLAGRMPFSFINSLIVISGAFGLFQREAVITAGGFDTRTVGEDMELIVRLHHLWSRKRIPYRIVFVPDPVCWTQVPERLKILRAQRNRWQRGAVESIGKHAGMLFNPHYGTLGLFGLPYFALLEILGPVLELLGYALTVIGLIFGIVSISTALLFFTASVAYGVALSISAVLLAEMTERRYPGIGNLFRLLTVAVLEHLWLHQLMIIWRTSGLIDGLRGKGGWGVMERKQFQPRKPRRTHAADVQY
jgi:cellulose synthase/poly-beta-1,6-N-acetylglucosamine synthase-like glycosyltransferase